jgi:hypothetical protein
MTPENLSMICSLGIGFCLLFFITWLFRIKSKGTTAWLMAGAFGLAAGIFWLISQRSPVGWIIGLGIGMMALLGADFAVRSQRQTK